MFLALERNCVTFLLIYQTLSAIFNRVMVSDNISSSELGFTNNLVYRNDRTILISTKKTGGAVPNAV